ncbi:hypothetical protein [Pontibacter roseus]|uniref:hypothetical protein n=1 Tax=Pontibacter roseus TaxID=336989 RepID=UPI00036D0123|nr:hypothetical protein [Pontibacter roseus]
MVETLNNLRERGYAVDLNLQPTCLECPQLHLELKPEEFEIDEVYRFEGASNPSDNSVAYAVSSDKGVKGVLVDAYGVYADSITPDLARKLRREY